MSLIYEPAEDSFMLMNFLDDYLEELKDKNISFLDMGTGSGILAETARESGIKTITCADINVDAVKFTAKKGFVSIESNLFDNISQSFDLITFNAPYLPEDELEDSESALATTGGVLGDEIPIKFVEQALHHLNKNGRIFLLVSSLTPLKRLENLGGKIVSRKKIWMEELLILEFKAN
jgi:release factor glutamine methyltransferase